MYFCSSFYISRLPKERKKKKEKKKEEEKKDQKMSFVKVYDLAQEL